MADMKIAILTVSDKGYAGEREDLSGVAIAEEVEGLGEIIAREIVPDERDMIGERFKHLADELGADLILSTGGTGFSPRDWTPEATLDVVDRQAPGLAEAMRQESLKVTPHAMLSRAVAGIRRCTLIINLPGSPRAVRECLQTIKPVLPHAIDILSGAGGECANLKRPHR
jgi:molybdopterin adenylyltransferase